MLRNGFDEMEWNVDGSRLTAEAFYARFGASRKFTRSGSALWSVRTIVALMVISIGVPWQEIRACACSEVVVGQGAVSSNMIVDDRTAELSLVQSDIELPGVIPVRLSRSYMSGNGGIGIFGYGWTTDFSHHLITTSGDIEVSFNGGTLKFKAADGYYNDDRSQRVTFSDTDEITVTDKGGERWVFDTTTKFLKEYFDQNGNAVQFVWKTEEVEFWGEDYTVYCPTKMTFPGGRELTLEYFTQTGKKHICKKAVSPSGFDVEYTYTNNLLTGIEKSNGQILSYNYHTAVHATNPAWVMGWINRITYANGAEVNVTYNGQYGQQGKLKVTKITGPLGYENSYSYTETPVEGQTKPDVTVVRTDSLDHAATYARTNEQKTLKITDALGNYTESLQNAEGLETSSRNKRGKITTYTYNTSGTVPFSQRNRLTMTNPLGKIWSYGYDDNNFLTTVTDPLNHTTKVVYDGHGNMLSGTNALGQTTVVNTYTSGTGPKGLLATTKNGLNNQTEIDYNGFGLIEKVTDASGNEWEFEYAADGSGNQTVTRNPLGKERHQEFNGFYKVSKAIDSLGNETDFEYDAMANLTKITDAENNETLINYDVLQQPTSIVDSLSGTTRFIYDSASNLTKLIDALNREYVQTFDVVNQTKTLRFPDSTQESRDYDANGNVIKLTRRDGGEISLGYDDAGRQTTKTWEDTVDTVFSSTYDDANRLTSITKVTGTNTVSTIGIVYNAANQITSIVAGSGTAAYAYDAAQRLSQITYPCGEVVRNEYNSRGLLESIKDGSDAAIADFTFDAAGRMTKKILPNGLESVYEYNDADWVTKITLRQTAIPNTLIHSVEYGYDKVGNRAWIKRNGGSGDVYQYDATYQITGVKYGVSNPEDGYDLALGASRVATYAYDAVGNRTQVVEDTTVTNYAISSLNEYTAVGTNTAWTYDNCGNLTGDGTWTFSYDRQGHLVGASKSGTTVSYKYDAIGRRVEKNVNGAVRRYGYSGQNLIEERDGSGNLISKYIYSDGVDTPVQVIKGGNKYYFQQDASGSVTALTDSNGAIFESYSYGVFGDTAIKDSNGNTLTSPSQPFLFMSREFDAEIGLYHYRTRAYSPSLGRFFQPDSIKFSAGDVNLYRFVKNSPINLVDPNGTKSMKCCMSEYFNYELKSKLWANDKSFSDKAREELVEREAAEQVARARSFASSKMARESCSQAWMPQVFTYCEFWTTAARSDMSSWKFEVERLQRARGNYDRALGDAIAAEILMRMAWEKLIECLKS